MVELSRFLVKLWKCFKDTLQIGIQVCKIENLCDHTDVHFQIGDSQSFVPKFEMFLLIRQKVILLTPEVRNTM